MLPTRHLGTSPLQGSAHSGTPTCDGQRGQAGRLRFDPSGPVVGTPANLAAGPGTTYRTDVYRDRSVYLASWAPRLAHSQEEDGSPVGRPNRIRHPRVLADKESAGPSGSRHLEA